MDYQLVCSFTNKRNLDRSIDDILANNSVVFDKIFVFDSEDIPELIISYNIDKSKKNTFLQGSLVVHRNKYTNTLYTINALNEVIRKNNNGVLDKSFPVDWSEYKNTLLITTEDELTSISLNLRDKIRLIEK